MHGKSNIKYSGKCYNIVILWDHGRWPYRCYAARNFNQGLLQLLATRLSDLVLRVQNIALCQNNEIQSTTQTHNNLLILDVSGPHMLQDLHEPYLHHGLNSHTDIRKKTIENNRIE
jgi:hypothetical protein